MKSDQINRQHAPDDLVLWYMEVTSTEVRPRRVAAIGDALYVLPRYRWTNDDERRPNEGEVERYSLRSIYGEVWEDMPLDNSPLRDVPELEDLGDYRYSDPDAIYDPVGLVISQYHPHLVRKAGRA